MNRLPGIDFIKNGVKHFFFFFEKPNWEYNNLNQIKKLKVSKWLFFYFRFYL